MFAGGIVVSGGAAINSAGPRFTGCRQQPSSERAETSARHRLDGAEEFLRRNSRFLLTNEFRS